jgi:hypothetical protein
MYGKRAASTIAETAATIGSTGGDGGETGVAAEGLADGLEVGGVPDVAGGAPKSGAPHFQQAACVWKLFAPHCEQIIRPVAEGALLGIIKPLQNASRPAGYSVVPLLDYYLIGVRSADRCETQKSPLIHSGKPR